MNRNITVLGSGSFGTAMAIALAKNQQAVRLWGYDPAEIRAIQKTGRHEEYLPGIDIPKSIELFTDLLQSVYGTQDLLIASPSYGFTPLLKKLASIIEPDTRVAWVTKGLEPKTGRFLHEVAKNLLPKVASLAVLAGPSFAKEVAKGLPTAIIIASNNFDFANNLKTRLESKTFKIKLSDDFIGTQISSVLKNVLAVATGISEGLGFGVNAQAALITQGMHELQTLGWALECKRETLLGLPGLGDIVLTCTDNQSRNRRFGCAIGAGKSFYQAKAEVGQVVEAVYNAQELLELSKKQNLVLPIVSQVNKILEGSAKPDTLLQALN